MKNLGCAVNVAQYLQIIDGVLQHGKEENRFFCRGQESMRLRLRPKIGRFKYASARIDFPMRPPHWKETLDSMLDHFDREYVAYHDKEIQSRIDLMTLAQHYGLPTQLLDWTLNPLAALYFACESKSENDGIVFILSVLPHHPIVKNDSDLRSTEPWQSVRPKRLDQRMINQESVFTFHSDPIADFGNILGKDCSGVAVPCKSKGWLLNQLECAGISRKSMYPGLQSLCEQISKQHIGGRDFEWEKIHSSSNPDYSYEKFKNDIRDPYLVSETNGI